LHAIDFQDQPLDAGTVFWLRPGQVHRIRDDSGVHGVLLLFASAALSPGTPVAAFAQDALRPSQWSADPRDALAATGLRHLELLVAVDSSVHDIADALRLALTPLIEPMTAAAPDAGVRPAVFERFAAAVEAEYPRRHHVRDYEPIVHAATRTIDRAVRDSRGISAKRFLDERIALQARRRMATSDVTVAALARELGFTEPTNFVKFYRRITGATPNSVRHPAGAPEPGDPGR
jgi:AraC-like DNA-binding protein